MSAHNFVFNTGTSGQVLTSNGPSMTPTYQNPSATGLTGLTANQVVIATGSTTATSLPNQAINSAGMLVQTATVNNAALSLNKSVTTGYAAGVEAQTADGTILTVGIDGIGDETLTDGQALYYLQPASGSGGTHNFYDGTKQQLVISDTGILVGFSSLPQSISFACEEGAPALALIGLGATPTFSISKSLYQKMGNWVRVAFDLEFTYTGGSTSNGIIVQLGAPMPIFPATASVPAVYNFSGDNINQIALGGGSLDWVICFPRYGQRVSSNTPSPSGNGSYIYLGSLSSTGNVFTVATWPGSPTGTQRIAGSLQFPLA